MVHITVLLDNTNLETLHWKWRGRKLNEEILRKWVWQNFLFLSFFVFWFLVFCHPCGMQKLPGQRWNLHHSYNQSHSNDSPGSSTHCARRELPLVSTLDCHPTYFPLPNVQNNIATWKFTKTDIRHFLICGYCTKALFQ